MGKPHPLAELIEQVKSDQGWSDEDLARRARRSGWHLSKQHVSGIRAQDPIKSLVPNTMRALAAALELPLGRVVEAALPSAGLPAGPPADWAPENAIRHDPGLSLDAKRMLLALLASARADERHEAPPAQVTQLPKPVKRVKPGQRAARKRQET